MKGGASGRSDGNAAAAVAILIAVLLGCFAISARCGDDGVPTDLAGEIGEVVVAAGTGPSSARAQPVCYKACATDAATSAARARTCRCSAGKRKPSASRSSIRPSAALCAPTTSCANTDRDLENKRL
ncbi:hypothetical protein C2845_PM09G13050 [Panicum miliaceum]|uniref:Uncharacterized protein n=1 Tax=Panicum miliaceum TaxID=4540 RepID=A0A3L6RZB3_PANMI|nr:hypothetical protein C2845_PM09G13050 [Panicum miliaceum]